MASASTHSHSPETREGRPTRTAESESIRYTPDAACIELKSLKYYLAEFRNQGIFYEAVTNRILDDLVAACRPRRMTVTGAFTARGGITTTVVADYVAGTSQVTTGKAGQDSQ